ncbi:MAG: acetylxylan esterase [Verrucomicrobiota bacterium]
MKKLPLIFSIVCALAFSVLVRGAEKAAEPKPTHALTATADRKDALYKRGEAVTFIVKLTEQETGKAADGEIEWTTTKDGMPPTKSGKATLQNGEAKITGSLDEPGFLQLRATYQAGKTKVTALAGAGIEPTAIKPSAPMPKDFAAFWVEKKKQLAAVPMKPRLTPAKTTGTDLEAFDLQIDAVGAPVSGYFARPAGAKPRSLPAILTVHGAGVRSSDLNSAVNWARLGALGLDINAHGIPNGQSKEFYDQLAAGELKDYRVRGRESRETIYFLGMFQRLVRAIDFLTAQPEWDGKTVVVSGSSQGGFQAIVAAGIDARVTYFVAGVPAGCDHTASLVGRIAGWPKFISTSEKEPKKEVVEAVSYFDGVNFAAQARAPGFFTVGFIDTTCPPSSVYAAYNALKTPKEIHHDIAAGHTNTPAAAAAMKAAVQKHFAAMKGQ